MHIDCGVGWFDLILKFHNEAIKHDPKYIFLAVKEKYARMQIAFKSENHYMVLRDIEDAISEESQGVCELCGGQGSMCEINSWEKNYCDSCFDNVVKINNYEDTTEKPIRTAVSKDH